MRMLAVLLLSLTPTLAAAADAQSAAARFTYAGYMGGLKVGWASIDVALAHGRYSAKLAMETGGVAGWVFDWRHGSAAYGSQAAAGAAPLSADSYRNGNISGGENRFVEVAYKAGIAEVSQAAPDPVADEGRPKIAPDLRADVLDPLSAIVALGQLIERTGSCAADFGVFDGRRRYQFVVTDDGETEIGKNRYAPFGGDVRRCGFAFERVAGFKKSTDGEETVGTAYFPRAAQDAPMMPVQIVVDSKYGATILHLREVETIDADLAEQAARKLDVTNPR